MMQTVHRISGIWQNTSKGPVKSSCVSCGKSTMPIVVICSRLFGVLLVACIAHGSLGKIEEHYFGGFSRMQGHAGFIAHRRSIARCKPLPVDFD